MMMRAPKALFTDLEFLLWFQNRRGQQLSEAGATMPDRAVAARRARILREYPDRVISEVRNLREQLANYTLSGETGKFLFVPTDDGPGAVGALSDFARAAAALGRRRVLLVDAGFETPTVHERLDRQLTPGFRELLQGGHPLEKALQTTDVPGLSFISAGLPVSAAPFRPDPGAVESFWASIEGRYDLALVHFPLSRGSVALEPWARGTHGAVLMINPTAGVLDTALSVKYRLSNAGVSVVGAVLNHDLRKN